MVDSAGAFDGPFDDGGGAGALRSTASSSSRIWKELFFSMSGHRLGIPSKSSLSWHSFPESQIFSRALSRFRGLPVDAGIRMRDGTHECQGHTQSPIDAYVDGRVVVRDSWKFVCCKMSAEIIIIITQGHKHQKVRGNIARPQPVSRLFLCASSTHTNTYRAPKWSFLYAYVSSKLWIFSTIGFGSLLSHSRVFASFLCALTGFARAAVGDGHVLWSAARAACVVLVGFFENRTPR